MCKDHDRQHYSIDLRNLAREITCGDQELASQLLDSATHDGLVQFWMQYSAYCEDARRERVETMMHRSTIKRRHQALVQAGEIVNKWDSELADMLPY